MSGELQEAIELAETDWQRNVLIEWGRLNPEPNQINMGRLGITDVVPSLCKCSICGTPSLIIPAKEIRPARAYCMCPQCFLPAHNLMNRDESNDIHDY